MDNNPGLENINELVSSVRLRILEIIKGEDYPPYKNGLPQYVQLKNVAVKPKLQPFKL